MNRIPEIADRVLETDVLIVGGGGAALRAAIEAAKANVAITVVVKGPLGKCGATLTAGTDIDIDSTSICDLIGLPGDRRDSPAIFFEDLVMEGKYVNDQRLVDVHVSEGPRRIKELVDWGMKVWGPERAAGHRYARGVLSTGLEVEKALLGQVRKLKDHIKIVEDTMVTDLLTYQGKVVGATGVDLRTGQFLVFKAKTVILATGGGQRIYPYTTAPEEMTGDGQAMAFRAGAELMDLQFVQFLTSTFLFPPTSTVSVNPFLIRGAWLLNRNGQRFMSKWDAENGEATTRDFVAIGIMNEILEGRGWGDDRGSWVYLSLRHLPENMIDDLYTFGQELLANGTTASLVGKEFFDNLKKNAIPAFPCSHFFCGGIRINTECEASTPGLYAAGEVAGGLNGSNRLSGNAITQIVVQGARAGKSAAEYALKAGAPEVDDLQVEGFRREAFAPIERKDGVRPIHLKRRIQKLAYENVGVLRDGQRLENAIEEIQKIKKESMQIFTQAKNLTYNLEWVDALQVKNMLLTLEMIARSALMRTESRGVHYRRDYPREDNKNWLKNIVLRRAGKEMQLETVPVAVTKFSLPRKEDD
jgi:succinate dehydrogenase/fumarate reductase flavoprotein subunit